ncbi:MAG: hypothetical protein ABH842_03075 [Candidatus Micrarchaeota archaeon]
MKPYLNLLIWVIFGVVIGLIIYALVQPSTEVKPNLPNQSFNTSLPNNTLQLGNDTQKKAVTLTVIESPCVECNYGELAIQQVNIFLSESEYVYLDSVQNLSYTSEDADHFISQYNITELPVIIVSGSPEADENLVSIWLQNVGSQESDGTLVSRGIYPPYYDIALGKSFGLVSGIAIHASDCNDCMDASEFMPPLEDISVGVIFSNKTILDENDSMAQELISKYNITKLPVLLLDEDFFVYPISQYFVSLGTFEDDGWFVLRTIKPPFKQLPDNQVRGIVDAIYIGNVSCDACFDPKELGAYFSQAAGFYLKNETYYESNSTEAATLIKKYNLTKIPSLLLSPEVSIYSNFDVVWQSQNNSIESDGWHILRNYDMLNTTFYEIG